MKYIYFLKYNNYANRIFKRETNMSDYLTNSYDNTYIQLITDCTMWNPNDGITAEITTPTKTDFSIEPDYLIAADEYNNIDSRWFITETVRDRKGQYQCYLKRDVFADAWDELMDATCNIDRAIVNKYSKFVYNPEPISVNQINTDELEIKDKTGCPWIVMYGSKKPSSVTFQTDYTYQFTTDDISALVSQNNYTYLPNDEGSIQVVLNYYGIPLTRTKFKLLPYGLNSNGSDTYSVSVAFGSELEFTDAEGVPVSTFLNAFKTLYSLKGSSEASQTWAYNNSIVFDTGTSKFYRITVNETSEAESSANMSSSQVTLYSASKDVLRYNTDGPSKLQAGETIDGIGAGCFKLVRSTKTITFSADEVSNVDHITAQVPAGGYVPQDCPYFIWAMPYGNITVTVDGTPTTTDKDINLMVANEMIKQNSQNSLYDAQILPFCPLPDEFIAPNGSISVISNTKITDNNTIKKTVGGVTSVAGYIFSIPRSSFKRQILLETAITVDDPKLRSITDLWRLYSPNYASSFEFSVAKNGGLTGFNVRCTYMPIQPYIRVAPIWGGLYGDNDDEVRGLLCGGDYSLPRVNDAWVQYREQNLNFQDIFNRQIDNMDVMRNYERIEQGVSIGVGSLAGGAIGGKAFGPVGVAGGAVGSLLAGVADYAISEGRYKENKSYATDIHQLQLGNVQAMPRTLARTTAFNVDNRYFPILTLYRCTSDEISSVVEFIKNRSMTVGVIGKPGSYVNNTWSFVSTVSRGFIQGSIVKIDSIHDTHFVDELNNEFQKGVYLR